MKQEKDNIQEDITSIDNIDNITSIDNTPAEGPEEPERDQAPASGPVVDQIECNIMSLVDDYINTLDDPEKIYQYDGVFIDMLKYIYKYYISVLLKNNNKNGNRYDYSVLNELFNIYTHLVYQYKHNKQPYIIEFSIFTHVSDETLHNIRYGISNKASTEDIENVKRWFKECEQGLLNGSGVADIFKLKSMYRYNDNLAPLPIEYQTAGLSVAELPDLSRTDSQKLLSGPKKGRRSDDQ